MTTSNTGPGLGEPAPWFTTASAANPRFAFSSAAGRPIVLSFFGSVQRPAPQRVLADVRASEIFDDARATFFGVVCERGDVTGGHVPDRIPGIRFFHDFDGAVSRLYGVLGPIPDDPQGRSTYLPRTYVLDPGLRVLAILPIGDGQGHVQAIQSVLQREAASRPAQPPVPILQMPRLFEPELCRALIGYYDRQGGEESGFMREENGRTVARFDHAHKRRKDCQIEDAGLRDATRERIVRRLLPEIRKAFQFEATRLERYIVACYDAADGGHFRAHRDNTTKGTAHRRFAVTINLNAEDYDGGELRFPEYGSQTFRAPTGGAVVFSCSMLHEATPVTRGVRYAFLPFLYDEAAARLRAANLSFLETPAEKAG